MNVLVLGSGGREHALAWAIAKSPRLDSLFVAPGNGGTATIAKNVPLDMNDADAVIGFARSENIDLVVVGPEAPLVAGVADAIRAAGIAVFGPGAQGARLEGSKSFSKEFMLAHGLPTARYKKCTSQDEAMDYLHEVGAPIVVKADGLAAGKGVVVAEDMEEAEEAVRDCFAGDFGEAGSVVVIEEMLEGPECSMLAFLSEGKALAMPCAQDHKRAFDGDLGPNTGGMGVYSPVPCVTPELEAAMQEIMQNAAAATAKEFDDAYTGVLYGGFMLTAEGPKLLEFNARFGDRTPFRFNGNVINDGSIPNLPKDACVEIPVFADKDGIHKTIVGELPVHLAILVSTTAQIENLVVCAAMTKSREDVYHAVMMDPLCSAVCSLQEIRDMCDLIFEKNTDYLGDYK